MYRYAPLLQRSCRSLLPSVGLSSTRYTTARSFFSTPFPPRPPRNTDEYRSTNNEYPTYSSGTSEIVEAGERGDWQRVEQLFEAAAASPARAAAASLSHADVKVYLEALVHTNRLHSLSLPNLTKVLLALSPGRPSPYRPTDTAASSDRSARRTSSSPPPTLATSPSQPLHVAIASSTSAPWQRAASVLQVLTSLAGLGLFVYIFSSLSGGGKKGGAGPFTVQATHQLAETPAVRFADVAGVDEAVAEVAEVVEYLRNPRKFTRLGARLPAGVLLSGPPGTGKTLLARAIAGEAGVPFFFASGSSFDEMFVGVGAKRVRDLFEDAKKHAPCIVFIDEIDAVGGSRENQVMHHRESLNQLLTEMDGFEANAGVVVIGATNLPDALDSALVRPGRFDKSVHVPPPDVKGRGDILRLYLAKTTIDRSVDVQTLARGTVGMTGADLRNLVNLGAIKAATAGKKAVTHADLEEAKDDVLMGVARRSTMANIPPEELRLTAYHEGGHALLAHFTRGADPLHKATIVPRGQSLGSTWQLPVGDSYSISKQQLIARIAVAVGGRAAEDLVFGPDSITTGASSDFRSATRIAQAMVQQYGFGEDGKLSFYEKDPRSAKEADRIAEEVEAVLQEQYRYARDLLERERAALNRLANALVEHEVLTGAQIAAVIEGAKMPV
eukprot:CAMPEP_0170748270 /NCGR_PEP_ID=MMETSP0437-20130122/9763_1 /TAXON_ID=0 /ORGANISM="Sexangularia sp." /LENGTH=668 /DNA_ID=CAMNT_0011087097 /DNA_START=46 /DNA_END=2048 /DNA_ORIENTATION=-